MKYIGTQRILASKGKWIKTNKEYLYVGLPYSEANPFWIPLDFWQDKGTIFKQNKLDTFEVHVNGYERWKDYLKKCYNFFDSKCEEEFKEIICAKTPKKT